jgi:hypothetical protein
LLTKTIPKGVWRNGRSKEDDSFQQNRLVMYSKGTQGSQRAADIYLGEFMRLWQHYRFRSIVNANADDNGDNGKTKQECAPNYLCEDDSWVADFFKPGL